jgi:lipopolysaccharide export system protein LptC
MSRKLPNSANIRGVDVFKGALNHSRFIFFLKFAIPAVGLLLVAALALTTILRNDIAPTFTKNIVSIENGRIIMANPKLDGVTKDNRPYTLKAVRAFQNIAKSNVIEMETINAQLPFGVGKTVTLSADSGLYDHTLRQLTLGTHIVIRTNDGTIAHFSHVAVNIAKNQLSTQSPMSIKNAGSQINADTMSVYKGGKQMVFNGNVRVTINPSHIYQQTVPQ